MRREVRPVGVTSKVRAEITADRPLGSNRYRDVAAPTVKSKPRCAALKADHTPCGALPIKDLGICVGHKRQQEAANAHQN